MRISAASNCVCVLSDGGRHGASAVGLMAQGDSVGYVSVPCRRRCSMVGWLLFYCLFMRISAAQCVCIVSDWGCHGGSLVDLVVGHVDLVG